MQPAFKTFLNKSIKWIPLHAFLLAGLLATGCEKQQAPPPAMPEVSVVTVQPQQVDLTTELPGRTTPFRIAEIRPQVNGLIQKRLFTEGADVRAGEVLYQIDPAPYQAALDNARASLGRSKANLPSIKARAERYKDLLPSKAVSQQDYDDAAAALSQIEADVRSWEAAVKTAEINLAYTRITAPISGRIGRSSVTEGAIVNAYQPMALAPLQQLDTIYVDVQQSTTELLSLRRSLEMGKLNPNGSGSSAVKLILADGSIYPVPGDLKFRDITVEPSTGTVTLRAVFPNPDAALLPGMFVQAVINEGVNEGEILVPQQGVQRDHRGDPYSMVVGADNVVQQRKLKLDRAVDDKWLVADGLDAGDQVIVEGLQKVRAGATVKAVPFSANSGNGAQGAPQSN